ncbi:MAG: 4,5-DOPA dioxygenase extradiol [Cypionkella sp.]
MSVAQSLQSLRDSLRASGRMPLVFLGHGTPMNAIEDTIYSRSWTELGRNLPRPQAILVVSAHWMTRGTTLVDVSAMPRTIHDFGNFPQKLFDQDYPAMGHPDMARDVVALLSSHHAQGDDTWGLDHGAWTILKFLFPKADVPVFQLSIDMTKDFDWHLKIGQTLSELRDRGVLILGSGNVVHNLGVLRPGGRPHDFALEFDSRFADGLTNRDFAVLTDRNAMGPLLRQAHPTVEHYLPALTIAGASDAQDALIYLTDSFDMGSLSMRSFVFHAA